MVRYFVLYKSRICSAKIPKSVRNRSNLTWLILIVYYHWMIFKLGVVSGTLNRCTLDRNVIHVLVCLFACFWKYVLHTWILHFLHAHTRITCSYVHLYIFILYNIEIDLYYMTIMFLVYLMIFCILLVTFGIFCGIITHMEQTCHFRCQKRGLPHGECPGRAHGK